MNLVDLIHGWRFKKSVDDKKIDAGYIAPVDDSAAFTVGGNYYGLYSYQLNLDKVFNNEIELVKKYREISLYTEVDRAIHEIVNEAIDTDAESAPVDIVLDDLDESDAIKDKIRAEFDNILELLDFNNEASEMFRKWYIDGKVYYQIIIDTANPAKGIIELRYISPLHIKKIREEKQELLNGIATVTGYEDYYIYSREAKNLMNTSTGLGGGALKISADSICFVHSGIIDEQQNIVYSNLQKALRPYNILRMVEDAVVIYRLSRAPERRVFYVDVGNLPKNKAEEYLKSIMNRYKNKMVYDVQTGEVKDSTNVMSMMEDYWMPRREGGKGTEVTTLQGGQNLGEIQDVEYFKKKLQLALNVPYGRMNNDTPSLFSIGRASETTREEVNFSKFISRLRKRYSRLFYELLKTQLLLKKIIAPGDWEEWKEKISFDYASDTFFAELKDAEILRERIATFQLAEPLIGRAWSMQWARKEILKQTDEDIEDEDEQIAKEHEENPGMMGDPNSLIPGMPFDDGQPQPGGMPGQAGAPNQFAPPQKPYLPPPQTDPFGAGKKPK